MIIKNCAFPLHIGMKILLFTFGFLIILISFYLFLNETNDIKNIPLFSLLGILLGIFFLYSGNNLAYVELKEKELTYYYWFKGQKEKINLFTIIKRPTADFPFYKLKNLEGKILKILKPHAKTEIEENNSFDYLLNSNINSRSQNS